MIAGEIIVSAGLFLISMLVAVYLIRYSNHQITHCLTSLEEKHNELVDLNGKLAKQILHSDKKLREELSVLKVRHKKNTAE
ncbi:MAG: hypothetical protein V1776_00025 [Candidatus Diapherotrites archaeon]